MSGRQSSKGIPKTGHNSPSPTSVSLNKDIPTIVISDDEEVVPSDNEIYAAGVSGYPTIPRWNTQKQNNPYVCKIINDDVDLHDTDDEVVCLTHNSRRLLKAKSETGENMCKFDYYECQSDKESLPFTHKPCRTTKDGSLASNKIYDDVSADDEKARKRDDSGEPLSIIHKHRKLARDGKLVNNIVVDLVSSDDEKPRTKQFVDLTSSDDKKSQTTNLDTMAGDEEPNTFTCSKTIEYSTVSNRQRYMLYDEDTEDEHETNNSVSEEGVWVNIDDLDEPFYPIEDYKPKYTIPDEVIVEDSSTGDSKYTYIDEDYDEDYEAYDRGIIEKSNMVENDMLDEMPDIDGKVHGENFNTSNVDEKVWEVDSNAYSVSYDSNDGDINSFINDGSPDYETSGDDDSEDEI